MATLFLDGPLSAKHLNCRAVDPFGASEAWDRRSAGLSPFGVAKLGPSFARLDVLGGRGGVGEQRMFHNSATSDANALAPV